MAITLIKQHNSPFYPMALRKLAIQNQVISG